MTTVVMTTYNPDITAPRFRYAQEALAALRTNLRGEFDIVLADDGSPDPTPLVAMSAVFLTAIVTGVHNGIGASLNRALAYANPGPWLYTTDDWVLTEPLDLEFPLWLLDQGYDLVRLGPIHPNLECATRFTAGHGWWLELDTYFHGGGFYFATRPFLAAPSLVQKVGLFDEGLDAYQTEQLYNLRCVGTLNLKFAAINLAGPWKHIGEYEVGDRSILP